MFVLSLFATALAVHAQSREGAFTTITVNGEPTRVGVPASYFDPTGVFAGTTIHSSLLPLICDSVCWGVTTVYGVCFLDFRIWNSTDYSDFDNFIQYSEDECAERLCDPDAYNHLYECANCIVANGGDTTRSTGPTSTASSSAPPQATWPLGPVDEEQGNGWLRNITDFCEARGTSGLGEAEVTAVPTTTGPYEATWTRGETITREHWTQLATISQVISSADAQQRSDYFAMLQAEMEGSTQGSRRPTGTSEPTSTEGGEAGSPTQGNGAGPTPTSGADVKAGIGAWTMGVVVALGLVF